MRGGIATGPTTETQWEDLLVRNSTTDTGQIPAQGGLSASPDIIPYGNTPLSDPTKLIANMNELPAKDVFSGEGNYFYVRGVNHAPKQQSGTMHLYYSRASLLMYPGQWKGNELKLNTGKAGSPVNADTGANFVTLEPFFWENVPPPPGGDHYCLVSRVETPDHPNPIPEIFQIPDFAKFISEHRGYAWRNIVVKIDPNAPTFEEKILYQQGEKAESVHFIVECLNVQPGCFVGFTCGTPGPVPPITLGKTQVTSPTANLGVTCEVPANFESNIAFQYWSNGTVQPEGAKFAFRAVWIPPVEDEWEGYGVDAEQLLPAELLAEQTGPVKAIALGSFTFNFSK